MHYAPAHSSTRTSLRGEEYLSGGDAPVRRKGNGRWRNAEHDVDLRECGECVRLRVVAEGVAVDEGVSRGATAPASHVALGRTRSKFERPPAATCVTTNDEKPICRPSIHDVAVDESTELKDILHLYLPDADWA